MCLLNLVEQHDRERTAAYLFGQLTAFFVADVARRGTKQAGNGVFLGVFGHVEGDEGVFVTEHEFGERLCELGLTHTGWAREDERAAWAVRVFEACTGAADRTRDRFDRFVLADDALVQFVFHVEQSRGLFFGELHNWDAG